LVGEGAIAGDRTSGTAIPRRGNIAGGITTLEEKSLGCIYKAGTSTIQEVIAYGSRPTRKGLVYMDTPAHDIEQLTGMVAGGPRSLFLPRAGEAPRALPSRP